MIPFDNIPRGLRVPLFFGELAIDGDTLGASQPPKPEISCVGATNLISMLEFIIMDQSNAIMLKSSQFFIDGIYQPDPEEYLAIEPGPVSTIPPPEGYAWNNSLRLVNKKDKAIRVELILDPPNQNLYKPVFSENPTLDDSIEGRYAFCLAAKVEQPSISCEGATQTMVFSPGPAFTGDINWTIEFDGVAYDLGKVWAGDIVNNMPSHIKDKVWMDWDGFWILENRDLAPHRFKLTPSPKPEFDPAQGWSNNKSLLINDDGSFMFCLSAKVNAISCEGATNNSFFNRFCYVDSAKPFIYSAAYIRRKSTYCNC